MIKKYNNISLAAGIPGIIIQVLGSIVGNSEIIIIGTLLLLLGFAYYAKAKGRNPAWASMAFFSVIGIIVLACLKDKTKENADR